MTVDEFKALLSPEQIETLKAIAAQITPHLMEEMMKQQIKEKIHESN